MGGFAQAIGGLLQGATKTPEQRQMEAHVQEQALTAKQNALHDFASQGLFDAKSPEGQQMSQGMDPAYIATLSAISDNMKSERKETLNTLGAWAKTKGLPGSSIAAISSFMVKNPSTADAFKPLMQEELKRLEQQGATGGKIAEEQTKGSEARKTQQPKLEEQERANIRTTGARTTAAKTTAETARYTAELRAGTAQKKATKAETTAHNKLMNDSTKSLTKTASDAFKLSTSPNNKNPEAAQNMLDEGNMKVASSGHKAEDFPELLQKFNFPKLDPKGNEIKGQAVSGFDNYVKQFIPPQNQKIYFKKFQELQQQHGPLGAVIGLQAMGIISDKTALAIRDVYNKIRVPFEQSVGRSEGVPETADSGGGSSMAGMDTGATSEEAPPAPEGEPAD